MEFDIREADLAARGAALAVEREALDAEAAEVAQQREAAEALARESSQRLAAVEERGAALQAEGDRLVVRLHSQWRTY